MQLLELEDSIDGIPPTLTNNAAILQRTMESLYEASPDLEDNTEGLFFLIFCVKM